MQQCLMDHPGGLSGDNGTYPYLFVVVEVQAGPEGLWE